MEGDCISTYSHHQGSVKLSQSGLQTPLERVGIAVQVSSMSVYVVRWGALLLCWSFCVIAVSVAGQEPNCDDYDDNNEIPQDREEGECTCCSYGSSGCPGLHLSFFLLTYLAGLRKMIVITKV